MTDTGPIPEPPRESPREPHHEAGLGEESQGFQMSARRSVVEIVVVVALLVGGVVGVLAIARNAATWLTGSVPIAFDRTLGEQSAKVLGATSTPCPNPEAKAYVERVAAPLLGALKDDRFTFQFVVVDTPEVNAFALPGGFVTVNSGLLEAAESGDEVAAVLSHELHHVLLRHGTQRMLRELGATVLLSAVFGGTQIAVPAKATHDFISNAYDRSQESEADHGGLSLMMAAGLDPRGMARFFDRLAKSGLTPPALLSTHPDPGDRAAEAEAAAKNARVTTTLPSPKGIKCR